MKLTCAICSETSGRLLWSPAFNAWYCEGCYQGGDDDVIDAEAHMLETLARQRGELDRLRQAHYRLVLAVWEETGEERMLELLGGTQWASHLRNTLWQIRARPEMHR